MQSNGPQLNAQLFDAKALKFLGPPFTAVALFESGLSVNRTRPSRDRRYDVAADGRFLIAEPVGNTNTTSVIAVVNWTTGLEKK